MNFTYERIAFARRLRHLVRHVQPVPRAQLEHDARLEAPAPRGVGPHRAHRRAVGVAAGAVSARRAAAGGAGGASPGSRSGIGEPPIPVAPMPAIAAGAAGRPCGRSPDETLSGRGGATIGAPPDGDGTIVAGFAPPPPPPPPPPPHIWASVGATTGSRRTFPRLRRLRHHVCPERPAAAAACGTAGAAVVAELRSDETLELIGRPLHHSLTLLRRRLLPRRARRSPGLRVGSAHEELLGRVQLPHDLAELVVALRSTASSSSSRRDRAPPMPAAPPKPPSPPPPPPTAASFVALPRSARRGGRTRARAGAARRAGVVLAVRHPRAGRRLLAGATVAFVALAARRPSRGARGSLPAVGARRWSTLDRRRLAASPSARAGAARPARRTASRRRRRHANTPAAARRAASASTPA